MHGHTGSHPRQGNKHGQGKGSNLLTVLHTSKNEFDASAFTNRGFENPCHSSSSPRGLQGQTDLRRSDHGRHRSSPFNDRSMVSYSIHPDCKIRRTGTSQCSGRNKLVYRSFQVFCIVIVGISLYALVENIQYLIRTYGGDLSSKEEGNSLKINDELQSWLVRDEPAKTLPGSRETTLQTSSSSSTMSNTTKLVLDINRLEFLRNNDSLCKMTDEDVYFMMIVHSAPENFEARQAIRSTWGSVKALKNAGVRLLFITGRMDEAAQDAHLVESSINRESEMFGDIVTAAFIDSYRNLTYKHLSGYKWVLNYCPTATFVLKADDDAFIDIFQLYDFIFRTYGHKPTSSSLICNVYPEGSKPIRPTDPKGTKWAVSSEEYPHSLYPKYCGGLAYLYTPDVAKRILNVSDKVKFFWIDDVFITGILRELAGLEPFYLNLRYSYDPQQYRKWLTQTDVNNGTPIKNVKTKYSRPTKFPFMIAHVERGTNFTQEMNQLWKKTLKVWSKDFVVF